MKYIFLALILFGTYIFQSCGGSSGDKNGATDTSNSDASKSSTDSTRGGASTPGTDSTIQGSSQQVDSETKDFVMKAASGGMMEVELGKVAQQKASSQRVKDFGSMMVTDHTKGNTELKNIAAAKNILVPSALMADHQKRIDDISKKSGADFDKAYMGMMVEDHKEDIGEFKKATNLKDTEIKNFADKTLPVLQKHLDSAQAIHSKM